MKPKIYKKFRLSLTFAAQKACERFDIELRTTSFHFDLFFLESVFHSNNFAHFFIVNLKIPQKGFGYESNEVWRYECGKA